MLRRNSSSKVEHWKLHLGVCLGATRRWNSFKSVFPKSIRVISVSCGAFRSVRELFLLDGKKVIVTGGGGGIGSAVAHGLAELGADVALLDIDTESVETVREMLKEKFSVEVLAIPVDVRDAGQVEEAVDKIAEDFGRVDILVNCHGIGQWSKAEEMGEEEWDRMLDVNLKGVFLVC